MTRLHAILLALRLAAPHWREHEATARYLGWMEDRYQVRAELVIAIARHESEWRPYAINPSSGTVGLLQVQPLNLGPCRASQDLSSQACEDARSVLADWRMNLRIGFADYAAARRYCWKRGFGNLPETWLQLPTGFDAVRHSTCGWRNGRRLPVPKMVRELLAAASKL